jgi:hypothetical protein
MWNDVNLWYEISTIWSARLYWCFRRNDCLQHQCCSFDCHITLACTVLNDKSSRFWCVICNCIALIAVMWDALSLLSLTLNTLNTGRASCGSQIQGKFVVVQNKLFHSHLKKSYSWLIDWQILCSALLQSHCVALLPLLGIKKVKSFCLVIPGHLKN